MTMTQNLNELVKLGAKPAATPSEAAKGKDLVIVILPESHGLETFVFGKDGVWRG